MSEHLEYNVAVKFMGNRKGQFIGDIDWDADGKKGSVKGCAKLKMLKWLTYPFADDAYATKDDDGSIHVRAELESQLGNGHLHAPMDVDPNGKVTGKIQLLKGIVLEFEGPVDE